MVQGKMAAVEYHGIEYIVKTGDVVAVFEGAGLCCDRAVIKSIGSKYITTACRWRMPLHSDRVVVPIADLPLHRIVNEITCYAAYRKTAKEIYAAVVFARRVLALPAKEQMMALRFRLHEVGNYRAEWSDSELRAQIFRNTKSFN